MNLSILNNGSVTYVHPASGSTSALDLSVCSPSLVLDYEWSTHDDLCGSDHFPVVLNATSNDEDPSLNRWNFGKADWLSFRALCQSRLTEEAVLSAEDPASIFTSLLINSAEESIPKHTFSQTDPRKFHRLTNNVNVTDPTCVFVTPSYCSQSYIISTKS